MDKKNSIRIDELLANIKKETDIIEIPKLNFEFISDDKLSKMVPVNRDMVETMLACGAMPVEIGSHPINYGSNKGDYVSVNINENEDIEEIINYSIRNNEYFYVHNSYKDGKMISENVKEISKIMKEENISIAEIKERRLAITKKVKAQKSVSNTMSELNQDADGKVLNKDSKPYIKTQGNLASDVEVKKSKKGELYSKVIIAENHKDGTTNYYTTIAKGKQLNKMKGYKKGQFVEVEGICKLEPKLGNDGKAKLDVTMFVSNTKNLEQNVEKQKAQQTNLER